MTDNKQSQMSQLMDMPLVDFRDMIMNSPMTVGELSNVRFLLEVEFSRVSQAKDGVVSYMEKTDAKNYDVEMVKKNLENLYCLLLDIEQKHEVLVEFIKNRMNEVIQADRSFDRP